MSFRLFVNSLPKSGTNYFTKVLDHLNVKYSGVSFSSGSLSGKYSFAKKIVRGKLLKSSSSVDVGLDISTELRRSWVESKLNEVQLGEYVTAHCLCTPEINHLLDRYGYKKFMVIREPLSVLVSWANYIYTDKRHFSHSHVKDMNRLDERILFLLNGSQVNGQSVYPFDVILDNAIRWYKRDDVEIIRFEELLSVKNSKNLNTLSNSMLKLCEYIGRSEKELLNSIRFVYGKSHTFRVGENIDISELIDNKELVSRIDESLAVARIRLGYLS